MPLKDVFNKLKTTIVGTNTSDIDSKLDSAVRDITAYRSQIGKNGYIELVKNLIAKTGLEVPSSFAQSTTVTPASLGQGTRLMRYKTYEAIVYNINYCFRALSVLTDNILSPDDITKTVLEITPSTFLAGEKTVNSDVRNCEDLIKKLKLEQSLDIIVKNTLQFGDFFCEIADAKTALTSRSAILREEFVAGSPTSKDTFSVLLEGNDNNESLKFILDYSSFEDKKKETTTKKKDEKDKIELDDVHLLYYEPKRVVKLQSDMFPVCFGFLIFPQSVLNPALMIQNQMVNSICQNILTSLTKKIPNLNQDNINTNDLKDIINTMIRESDPSKTMNIRYVPPSKMQHFYVPSTRFYPYGESIFDPNVFTAKLIIALETALVIFRLNRSTEKRKISVEVGLPRDARKAIEKIKEEFRKRKVSIDTLGTVDTIPSMINTFEDIYLPAKDGKNYVDVTSFAEGMVDTRGKVDEIKLLRDQLVSSLGIPASFLNIEENLCLMISTTYIPLLNGDKLSLEEIIKQYEKGVDDMYVYSYNHESGRIVPGRITWAGITKKQTKVIRVWLDNEKYIDCTPEHPFMLRDGSYKEAQYLVEGESLMSFIKLYCGNDYFIQKNNIQQPQILNHKVTRIEFLEGLHDTGDITVEKYSNFAVDAGVIVHNSNKAALGEENILFARTIVNNQKYFCNQIKDLIKKIYEIVDPEKALTILDNVNIALPPPKSLQFERESKYLSDLANLVQTLEGIGVPKEWSKKKYLTSIDWDEVKKFEIDDKIEKSLGNTPPDGMEGVGGMGGMSGMPPAGGGMGGF